MRLIDADRLLEDRRKRTYYHLPNGDTAIPIIDIEHAPTITVESQWISVTERLPDISKSVLICDIDGDVYLGHRTRYGNYYPDFGSDRIKSVTAWREPPEPYKEGEQDD